MGDTTGNTTYGSLNLLCKKLQADYANRRVIFITPAYQTAFPHKDGITYKEVGTAMKNVCGHYGFPVYDNGELSGINEITLSAMTVDHCHWNDAAHQKIGKQIAAWMLKNI